MIMLGGPENIEDASSYRRSDSAHEIFSPVYSMMRVPLGIARAAKTPRPWIGDSRTS